MQKYFAYWKRGWWAWLLVLLMNVWVALFMLPVAALLSHNKAAYAAVAVLAWLTVFAPLWGWLFEKFAAMSTRIEAPAAPPKEAE